MIRNTNFDIIRVGDDNIAVPVGEEATSFHGVVALSEEAAFLLDLMNKPQTIESLVNGLTDEYDVDRASAEADINAILKTFFDLKLIFE